MMLIDRTSIMMTRAAPAGASRWAEGEVEDHRGQVGHRLGHVRAEELVVER